MTLIFNLQKRNISNVTFFELPCLDWCRFENSKIFRQLTAYLEELEKQEIFFDK